MNNIKSSPGRTKKVGKFASGLSAVALAVAMTAAPSPALAWCGVCEPTLIAVSEGTASIMQAIEFSTESIIEAIEVSTFNIINAIGGSTSSLVGANEKTISGSKELTQGHLNYVAAGSMAETTAKVQDNFTAPEARAFKTCEFLAQAQQASSATVEASINAKAVSAADAQRNAYTANAPEAAKQVLDDYMTNYCSQSDFDRKRCTTVAPLALQGAAHRADVLLQPSSNHTYSAEESKAASAFITMVTNPVPTEMLPQALEKAPGGNRFILEQMNASAQMNVAQHSLEMIKAMNDAPDSGSNTNAAGYSGALSVVGLMHKFVDDRFGNPDYSASLQGLNDSGMLREINMHMAFNNWVDYHSYLQNERIEALVATQLASAARERSDRQLSMARGLVGKTK